MAPNEKPETKSANPPAVWTAAMSAPITNANRRPTSSCTTISPATCSGWVGMVWPCMARPVSPIASATATMPLHLPGNLLGGEQRREHEQRADPPEHQEERGDRLAAAQCREHVVERQLVHPISDGIDMYRFWA